MSASEKSLEFSNGGSTIHFLTAKGVVVICFHAAEKLLVLLRDSRKLLGILRSFDQFGINIISSVVEGKRYCNFAEDSEVIIVSDLQPMLFSRVLVRESLLAIFTVISLWVCMLSVGRMLF